MKSYLLSIVVPTKDRYPYLKRLIELVKSFDSDEVELVIQDNSDDNKEIVSFINSLQYEHLKYFYKKGQLSVSENADRAILNSTGEYVCFIGDDDGVIPEIIDVIKYLKEKGAEAILANNPTYNWPDYFDDKSKSRIFYSQPSGTVKVLNTKQELEKVVKGGFRGLGGMPKVYHGIVKRSVLDKLYNKLRTFSPGGSPDMATAVSLSLIIDKIYYVNLPLIINGQSIHVGGGERALKGKLPKIEEVSFLPKSIVQDWNPKIPDIWCSDTIWPQSAIYALSSMGYDGVKSIDYDNLLAFFFVSHGRYYKQYKHLISNTMRVHLLILYRKVRSIARKIKIRLTKTDGRLVECNITTINDASKLMSDIIKPFSFPKI